MTDNPMTDEAREEMNRYKREWNRQHPEKRRAQQARYWAKRAKERKAQQQEADKE
jgi:hypothetical protein